MEQPCMPAGTDKVGTSVEGAVTPWLSGIKAILYLAFELAKQTLTYDLAGFRTVPRSDKP
jgi:hypothetical protein